VRKVKKVVNLIVEAGNVTPAPPVGPALAPFGLNLGNVVKVINEKTKDFKGLKVPIKVIIDPSTKQFEVEVGLPTTAELIKKAAGIEKGSSTPGKQAVGNISFEKLKEIAEMKFRSSKARTLENFIKEVIGTCVSMGISIDGKDPKQFLKEWEEKARRKD